MSNIQQRFSLDSLSRGSIYRRMYIPRGFLDSIQSHLYLQFDLPSVASNLTLSRIQLSMSALCLLWLNYRKNKFLQNRIL